MGAKKVGEIKVAVYEDGSSSYTFIGTIGINDVWRVRAKVRREYQRWKTKKAKESSNGE